MKHQAVSAAEESYLKSLDNMHTRFSGVTIREMIYHLSTSYGIVSASELERNKSSIQEMYDPENHIKNLFNQL